MFPRSDTCVSSPGHVKSPDMHTAGQDEGCEQAGPGGLGGCVQQEDNIRAHKSGQQTPHICGHQHSVGPTHVACLTFAGLQVSGLIQRVLFLVGFYFEVAFYRRHHGERRKWLCSCSMVRNCWKEVPIWGGGNPYMPPAPDPPLIEGLEKPVSGAGAVAQR